MKFRANDQTGPGQFNTATVYIFSSTGELILEKDFPIGIKFKTLPAPKKKKPGKLPEVPKFTAENTEQGAEEALRKMFE